MIQRILRPLASLYLTIGLIVLSILLIFLGTLASVESGVFTAEKLYFHSIMAWAPLRLLVKGLPGSIPIPGGYTLGTLMLVNLLAAHATRFQLSWKRSGILLIHLGLILLLVGEGMRSQLAVESQMTIDEGQAVNWAEDPRKMELAITDPSPAEHDRVVAIPQSMLTPGQTVKDARLPFEVTVEEYYRHSRLLGPMQAGGSASARATAGDGVKVTVEPLPPVRNTDKERNVPSAYVTLTAGGQPLGRYLVSLWMSRPQEVKVGEKAYQIQLRPLRYVKPYTIHLHDFRHDRYLGTEMPRNFSSEVQLIDPSQKEDRRVIIKMNEPLRYRGDTLYQSAFKPGDGGTVLQVVHTPSKTFLGFPLGTWLMPYIACVIGGLGMFVHFGIVLVGYVKKMGRRTGIVDAPVAAGPEYQLEPRPRRPVLAPLALLAAAVVLGYSTWAMFNRQPKSELDLTNFGRLPVVYQGRTQPLDSVARNTLKSLSGKQTLRVEGKRVPATEWLLDVMAAQKKASEHQVFRIDDRGVLGVLKLDFDRKLFSLKEIIPGYEPGKQIDLRTQAPELLEQLRLISSIPNDARNSYQKALGDLEEKLGLYLQFSERWPELYAVPPLEGGEWRTLAEAVRLAQEGKPAVPQAALTLATILQAYHDLREPTPVADQKPLTPAEAVRQFNQSVADYHSALGQKLPEPMAAVTFEWMFHRLDIFTICIAFYLLAFILVLSSWLGWTAPLSRGAFWIILLALWLHTAGLGARIFISGRPPVTNLSSSAIFIAWGGVAMAVVIELMWRNGIGSLLAAVMGFLSLLIADRLAVGEGDSLSVLRAVLDTNFWLATHVIAITLGYAATFLAGLLAIVYVVKGVFTKTLVAEESRDLSRMIYSIVCFAMLFSFVGTVLGGIWADQSWGRFWGWDPKENGAALIVLWLALVLHARWAGLIRERGLAVLAIAGNIVTAWSWFGTNMLATGLHSYGFMDKAAVAMTVFVLTQIALITIGTLPLESWRSGANLMRKREPVG